MFHHRWSKEGQSLECLHVLLELQEAGSLAKAADSNAVWQSHYSRQLKMLSEYFGASVAERQGRELKLLIDGIACLTITLSLSLAIG